jgi:hypothetical protein
MGREEALVGALGPLRSLLADNTHDDSPRRSEAGSPKTSAPKSGRYVLPAILAAALVVRLAAMAGLPPATDVYYYLTQAVHVLLSGGNPYEHTYSGIPASLATPGAQSVFAYLPFTILYLIPFYLLGDIRLGLIAADLVVGACLYLYGGRWRSAGAALYLFMPFTVIFSTYYLNAALIAMAFIALFLLLESRGRGRLAAVSLGVALASIQFSALVAPCALLYYVRRGRWVELALAGVTAAAIILPFLVESPSFVSETLLFQFSRPVTPLVSPGGPVGTLVNPSLDAIALWAIGHSVPGWAKAVIELLAIALFMRVRDLSSLVRNSTLFVLLSVFVLPNDFFWAYLELPFMLAVFWMSAPKNLAFVKKL